MSQVGRLMWAAQGITHAGDRTTAPSAGALFPLELHVVTSSRVRRYLPVGHRAEQWTSAVARSVLADATPNGDVVRQAPATFVIAGITGRTARKHGPNAS